MPTPTEIVIENVAIPTTTFQAKKTVIVAGHPRIADTKQAQDTKAWWWNCLWPHRPEKPLSGPIVLTACLVWVAPGKTSKKTKEANPDGIPKITRPDLDNLVKALLDTMTQQGFWKDDSQVCELHLQKKLAWDKGGVYIYIEPLNEQEDQLQEEEFSRGWMSMFLPQ